MALLYTLTDSPEFINIDGIAGTSAAGVSFSLRKSNINKFTKDQYKSLVIVMVDNTDYNFDYTTVKDPNTGVAFASLAAFEEVVEGFAGSGSSNSGTGGAGGGSIVYTNASGDFTATITAGTTNITIVGLPFVLEAKNVVSGSIKKIAVTTNKISTLLPTTVSVAGGVITLGGISAFVAGDQVVVTLIGPDKAYDRTLDIQKTVVQNPEYAHTTSVETLVDETNLLGYKGGPGEAGSDTNTLVMAAGAFSDATHALGYTAYQTTDSASAKLNSFNSATSLETDVLSGGATWLAKNYSLPQVKRYEISMDTYNYLSIHYRLRCLTFCNAYFKIYGTLDAAATVDSDAGWVNLSETLLKNADGLSIPTSLTAITEDILILDTPTPMLKYMIKLVVESNSSSPNTNSFKVFVKKSS